MFNLFLNLGFVIRKEIKSILLQLLTVTYNYQNGYF